VVAKCVWDQTVSLNLQSVVYWPKDHNLFIPQFLNLYNGRVAVRIEKFVVTELLELWQACDQ
jgi:hypothetical protein